MAGNLKTKYLHRICSQPANASSPDKMTAGCLRFGKKYSNKNATERCPSAALFVSACQKV
jgi:hypothetical protein